MNIKRLAVLSTCTLLLLAGSAFGQGDQGKTSAGESDGALRVLLIAGGCCHDYAAQTKILKEGIEKRIKANVTVVYNPDTTTRATFEIYEKDDWASNYDVVVHDECCASVTDKAYVKRILDAHRNGMPAVNLHCAMHSYRWGDFKNPVEVDAGNAGWYEMIGIQSSTHGPKVPIEIKYLESTNPIVKGLEDWTTGNEELYNNLRMFSTTEILASGKQIQPPNKKKLRKNPDAKSKVAKAAIVWTNMYGPNKTKIFNTSLGHFNETVKDKRYLDLVVRGLPWASGNWTAEGKPAAALAR